MQTSCTVRKFFVVAVILAIFMVCFSFSALAAGEETLPYGWYEVGSFSFTNYNLTPQKTVPGRYLALSILYSKPTWDAGIGDVKLTIDVRDANTGVSITGKMDFGKVSDGNIKSFTQPVIDLGYSGRKIQIWFDASSAGVSNGNYRSLTIHSFRTYVE